MKSHPRFKIPLTWGHLTHFMGLVQEAWVVEKLSSDTLVIPLTRGPMFPYTVARVHGAWSPHIPDKTPHYRVKHEYDLFGVTRENVEEHHTVRLAQVQVGAHLLVEMPANDSLPRICEPLP